MEASMFKLGDVVSLRSGGARMTVEAVEGDEVHCVWTTNTGSDKDRTFDAGMLKDADEPKVSINIHMGEKTEP
jgi:uncharacterized protein YodC (DUF2158 family)